MANVGIINLVMFGDSITAGWNGSGFVAHPLAYWIGKKLGIDVANRGQNEGRIVGDRPNDLLPNIQSTDLTQYDACTVAYGINDLDDISVPIKTITDQLNVCLDAIYAKNADIKVYALLPLPAFVDVPNPDTPKAAGYSENGLIDALKQTFQSRGITTLDWRQNPIITVENHQQLLADGVLHPSQSTYELLGNRIADFISENPRLVLRMMTNLDHIQDDLNDNFDIFNRVMNGFWGNYGSLGLGDGALNQIKLIDADLLDREFRLQMIGAFKQAQQIINELVGMIGSLTGELNTLMIPIPYSLVLNIDKLNDCFKVMNQALLQVNQIEM
ncbi:SGNH/GDSL hydrolase family protein [Furfurilactobacillus curtus]|uniref:SGNH hydrolase-type esterase domain-containing protein n=1 Tax=Furfurilactobacillus curtus TaxID=1746200 RepID=A0ABQ5JP53_9LACO